MESQSLWWNVPSFPGNYSAQARKDFFAYHASSRGKNIAKYAKSKNKMKHHPASKSILRKNGHDIEECSAQEYEIMKVCYWFCSPAL